MLRLWVNLTKDEIKFCRYYRNDRGDRIEVARSYKSTPARVWRVLCNSNKYTVYKG